MMEGARRVHDRRAPPMADTEEHRGPSTRPAPTAAPAAARSAAPAASATLAVGASLDAWSPAEIAARIETVGVTKARADLVGLLLLSGLAGAFIALGGLFYAVVVTGSELGLGPTRLLGGAAFSLGLVLVVVAGAELFTGNNLVAMAWASRRITGRELLRNWVVVYAGNVVGALGTVGLVLLAGTHDLGGGAVEATLVGVAASKAQLPLATALARGVLCNALVCLAVWLAFGGRTVTDKVLAIVLPITAFVAMGFEHSIANWFFLPLGLLLAPEIGALPCLANLAVVTVGNVIGGTLLVAGVYWTAYLRPSRR